MWQHRHRAPQGPWEPALQILPSGPQDCGKVLLLLTCACSPRKPTDPPLCLHRPCASWFVGECTCVMKGALTKVAWDL